MPKKTTVSTKKNKSQGSQVDPKTQAILDYYKGLLTEISPGKMIGRKTRRAARIKVYVPLPSRCHRPTHGILSLRVKTEFFKIRNNVAKALQSDEDVSEGSYIWTKVVVEGDAYVDRAGTETGFLLFHDASHAAPFRMVRHQNPAAVRPNP